MVQSFWRKISNKCLENVLKKSNLKAAEATGDLIGKRFVDKVTQIALQSATIKSIRPTQTDRKSINYHLKIYITRKTTTNVINEIMHIDI